MKELLKNIKETFARLFGFKQPQQVAEWGNEYLKNLEKSGKISSSDFEAFKESENFTTKLLKQLESDGKEKGKQGGKVIKTEGPSQKETIKESTRVKPQKESEREGREE